MSSKKAKKTGAHKSIKKRLSRVEKTNGLSYDTKLIIVLLLLVFVYPLGIIFMWAWMRTWAGWLKTIVMLPLFIGLLMAILSIVMIRSIVGQARMERIQELQRMQHERQMQLQGTNQFTLTPSPTIFPSH